MRAGDVASAGVGYAGERIAFTVPAFSVVIIVMTAGWLAVVAMLTSLCAQRVAFGGAAWHPAGTA